MAKILRSYLSDDQCATLFFDVAPNQTIKQGDFVQVDPASKQLQVAAAASTTIVGIAEADYTTGASVTAKDRVPVSIVRGQVCLVDFTGTTKTTLTDADRYTVNFDLGTQRTMNLDDTAGGFLKVLAYNNAKKQAEVVFNIAALAF